MSPHRGGWLVALGVMVALAGCRPEKTNPTAKAAPDAAPVAAQPPAKLEAKPAEQPEPQGPPVTGAKLEGLVLNPKSGVKILLPEGWEQGKPDDGALLLMIRRQPLGGVHVNVTLDYAVDEQVPAETRLSSVEQEFVAKLPTLLADRKFQLLDTKRVSVAGAAALAVRGDLESDGKALRLKQYLILQDGTFWTLSAVGPRDQFDKVVEKEFDAIAATLELQ